MSTPPYLMACLMVIASAYVSDKYKCRGYVNAFNYFVAVIGFIVLEVTETPSARYIGTFLVAMGAFPGIAISIAWNSNNIRGSPTKRAVGIALQNSAGSFGGIIGSFVYLTMLVTQFNCRYVSSDKPGYKKGHAVMIALTGFSFICLFPSR
jgi:sugar phosphate permease